MPLPPLSPPTLRSPFPRTGVLQRRTCAKRPPSRVCKEEKNSTPWNEPALFCGFPFSAPLFPERYNPPNPPRTGDRAGGISSDSGKGTENSGIPVVRKKSSSDGGDQVDFTSARSVIFSGRGSRWTFPDRNVFRRRDDRFR